MREDGRQGRERNGGPAGVRIRIHDLDYFRSELETVVKKAGSQANAARWLGNTQSQVSRLLAGQCRAIRVETYARLRARVPSSRRSRLDCAMLTFVSAHALRVYANWLNQEAARYGMAPLAPDFQTAPTPEDQYDHAMERQQSIQALRAHLERQPWYRRLRKRFEARVARQGHDRERIELAIIRALGPLTERTSVLPIERDWRELSDLVLERFIRAGFTREAILLARPNAIVRAQIHDPEITELIETARSNDSA